jgi:ParB family chromosome partitioning protein
MLSLPNDLKQAIRENGLKGAHALALSVLSAKTLETSEKIASKERIKATEQVLSQDLNVGKTRELIAQIKAKYIKSEHSPSKQITAIQRSVEKLSKENIANIDSQQLVDLRTLFQQKLAEIESILEITNG